jgi:restriction system protein
VGSNPTASAKIERSEILADGLRAAGKINKPLKNMSVPKFDQLFLPILKILQNGRTRQVSELPNVLIQQKMVDLTPEELQQTTLSGNNLFYDRVSWAKAYLKQAALVAQPARGLIVITPKGQHLLQRKIQSFLIKDLKQDSDFKKYQPKNQNSKEKQIVSGNNSPQDLIESGFQELNHTLKKDLLSKLRVLDPFYFQKVILLLLQKMGYGAIQETRKSSDGGIDGIMNQDQLGLEKIYIQAKRYGSQNRVHELEMRNFIGAMSDGVNKGIFATTSDFSQSAIDKAKNAHNHQIILLNGEKLVALMIQFNVGIQIKSTYTIKEIDEDFFELG